MAEKITAPQSSPGQSSPGQFSPGPARRRLHIGRRILLGVLVLLVLLVIFWNWDWLIPLVDARASAALGRKVTMAHLHVRLGRTTRITADDIAVADPQGFAASAPKAAGSHESGSPEAENFASIEKLVIDVDVMSFIRDGALTLPSIAVEHPVMNIRQRADGADNYTLKLKSGGGKPARIGELIIRDGHANVRMARLKADMDIAIATAPAPQNSIFEGQEITATAKGTYSGQPITARFEGGALLTLRDPSNPYPVDLHIMNGSTTVALTGTVEQPLTFGGARLKLSLAGQDMANLYPLTGIPIPATPPYSVTGNLDYAKDTIRFDDFHGRVGSSDLEGDLAYSHPISRKPLITADLASRYVDLTDLAGFLGATPGKTNTPGENAATRAKVAAANANPYLLPHTPLNLPKINLANVALHYKGERIINRDVPLDNVVVSLSIENGRITLHPLNFAVGSGTVASDFDLDPVDNVLHTRANIDFRRLPLSRLMAATHAFAGSGTVGGSAHLVATGNSVAAMLGHGTGSMQLFMNQGGQLSALLVDLAGLQLGDAVLSALGIPVKTQIQCLVADFALNNGILDPKAFLIATREANILGSGSADLRTEKLNLALSTQATHFQIGSLSTPIHIGGTLKNPSMAPAPGPLAARAGSAVGLGILFPPLALIPTIRLGLGDRNACVDTLQSLHDNHPSNPT